MTDDLVERLRNPVAVMRPTITDGRLAADRIEALTAERDEWKKRHFKMRDERDAQAIAAKNYADFNHAWRERADKAEAERDALTAERDRLASLNVELCDNYNTLLVVRSRLQDRAEAAEADNARLRGAIEYVLDGYGLNAPDFERQPEDDEDNWIVLTLRAALNTGKGDQAVAGAAPGPFRVDPEDWTEDYAHENGNYMCLCATCGKQFFGHKRRVVCRVCAQPEPVAGAAPERIWATGDGVNGSWTSQEIPPKWGASAAEYVHKDTVQAQIDAAVNSERWRCAKVAELRSGYSNVGLNIAALIRKGDQP